MRLAGGHVLGLLLLTGFEPPDTAGCKDHFENSTCKTDNGLEGTCVKKMLNTAPEIPDAGPRRMRMMEALVCFSPPPTYRLKDFAGGAAAGAVIFVLILLRARRQARKRKE